MFKSSLRSEQSVSGTLAIVEPADECADWAAYPTRAESRGPGDYVAAMGRVARKAKVTRSLIWALHYRKPKDVWTKAYKRLQAAYEQERKRQMRKLIDELREQKKSGASPALVAEVMAAAGLTMEDLNDE